MESQTVRVIDEAPPRSRGSYKWWVVAMLWCICFLNYADRQAISALFPVLRSRFGFSATQLGLIGSAFMWTYAFGGPFAGFIGDRLRRKDLILGGCCFWSLITLSTGWCGKLWQFVFVRGLEGLGETFYFPSSMSLISDYHGPATRSKAMSLHQSSVYIGTVLGSWLAAVLAEHVGWRAGFYLFGTCGIVLALVLMRFLREPPRGQSDRILDQTRNDAITVREALAAVFQMPTAILLMAAFVGANSVATIFLIWMPTFLTDKFHFGLATAGLFGTVFIHLSSAVGAPLGGVLADRLRRDLPGGRILVQGGGLLVGAGFLALVGVTTRVGVLLTAMTLLGFCKGLYDSNIFASLYDTIEPRARSTAAGIMNTVGWAGGALGPLFVGMMTGSGPRGEQIHNMSRAIAMTGAIYLVVAALLLCTALVFAPRDCRPTKAAIHQRS